MRPNLQKATNCSDIRQMFIQCSVWTYFSNGNSSEFYVNTSSQKLCGSNVFEGESLYICCH